MGEKKKLFYEVALMDVLEHINIINKNADMLKMNAWRPWGMALSRSCNTLYVIR